MISKKLIKGVIAIFFSGVIFLPNQVKAYGWHNRECIFGNSKKTQICKETKGDAILKGKQGFLHTFTFPNGKKFYWFYGLKSILCDWKDTYIREEGKNYWLELTPSCTDDGWIDFSLPSGTLLFKIYYLF